MNKNEILAVAVSATKDLFRGVTNAQFSKNETAEELRAALIDLNGGKTTINPKTFYRGSELFELVEELIPVIINEGFVAEGNPLFNMIDYRNIAAGDETEFYIKKNSYLITSEVANGILNVRRQRVVAGRVVPVVTTAKIIRIYENLGRMLAGRCDFNEFVNSIAESYKQGMLERCYDAMSGITSSTAGLDSNFVKSGSIVESTLLTLCEDVSAKSGKKARLIGTPTALRKLGSSITTSNEVNSDLYNLGFVAKFNGYDCFGLNQQIKMGTSATHALKDDQIWVVGAEPKFIKFVTEGTGILKSKDALNNADMTEEYAFVMNDGLAVAVSEAFGLYRDIV